MIQSPTHLQECQCHVGSHFSTNVSVLLLPQFNTITLKEVSRIALVEAKQFLTLATEKAPKSDLSKATDIYKKAETLYDKGEYKEAQKSETEFGEGWVSGGGWNTAWAGISDYFRKIM